MKKKIILAFLLIVLVFSGVLAGYGVKVAGVQGHFPLEQKGGDWRFVVVTESVLRRDMEKPCLEPVKSPEDLLIAWMSNTGRLAWGVRHPYV